jgi:hypothetical protein
MELLEVTFGSILRIDKGTFWARLEKPYEPEDHEAEISIDKVPKRDLVGVKLQAGTTFIWVIFRDDRGATQSKFIFNYLGYWKAKDIADAKKRAKELYKFLNAAGE